MPKIITNKKQSIYQSLKKLFVNRSLILAFVKRDLKIQYAQTFFGVLLLVFQPLIAITVYTLFFNNIIKLDTGDIPYPVFVFSGILFWQYFLFVVINSSNGLIINQNLITKIAFPKLMVVISKPIVGLLSFGINLLILTALLFFYKIIPTIYLLSLPMLILLVYFTGLSLGIWLNSLTLKYRDLHHLIPTIIGYAIWITPVFYPVSIVPTKMFFIVYLNPVAGIIEWFRWTIFGGEMPSLNYLYGIAFILIFLIIGLFYFNRVEHKIADKV